MLDNVYHGISCVDPSDTYDFENVIHKKCNSLARNMSDLVILYRLTIAPFRYCICVNYRKNHEFNINRINDDQDNGINLDKINVDSKHCICDGFVYVSKLWVRRHCKTNDCIYGSHLFILWAKQHDFRIKFK